MKPLWYAGVTAAVLVGMPLAAMAQEKQEIYFNRQGQITNAMSSVAYVRHYDVKDKVAQVQDFYYPSMKKYSDPYQIPVAQVKVFVPTLENGTVTFWHFNGRKKLIVRYKNGKPDGEWISWYPSGNKSAVIPYVQGMNEGVGSRYYRNGNKESEIQFKDNKANGYWKQWYPNGQPKAEMLMEAGKPTSIVSWDEDGMLLSELIFEDDRRSGVVLDWHPNGAKKSETVYFNGNLVKKTIWDEEGYVLSE
ncbi:toxin-antitoxin system YwqK family antitoxin [Neisseria zalophi]|uniref:Toxin-antitoxin system YwqK family antitoxin n=1 Tax=Neisseria zalophi TaxID=640030 RepID=A0A5J6PU55_9NEIS|nr:toxin-antitoxin system YwqK family antitoxin [Neisseria zalophi]QEY26231.1 toxin-antitoxin system YwqK family antitoxin [Neisseria zalophi]